MVLLTDQTPRQKKLIEQLHICSLSKILKDVRRGDWSLASPAVFLAILAAMLLGFPLLEWLYRCLFWIYCGIGSPPNTWRPAVRTTATRWNQAAPARMSYHEAWLIMRHKNILSSYSSLKLCVEVLIPFVLAFWLIDTHTDTH